MKVEQSFWRDGSWTVAPSPSADLADALLVLAFGDRVALGNPRVAAELRARYPHAAVLGCSTSGEIHGTAVSDGTLTATAVHFEHTRIRITTGTCSHPAESRSVGRELGARLATADLAHVLVISPGLAVNGSELVAGLVGALPPGVTATGGLAGDGTHFEETVVLGGDHCGPHVVAALGLYGSRIRVGHGTHGGWEGFGPLRQITRARGNVLFEVDHEPALDLYKRYLGEHAAQLPASAYHFPLSVAPQGSDELVVRTVLALDEVQGSMTFAGDVPCGAAARLTRGSFADLIGGAAKAAAGAQAMTAQAAQLAILISCVGRRIVLGPRVEDEVEAVRDGLSGAPALTGFYSYGEIAPSGPAGPCRLHNQTMTVTTLVEV